MATTPRENPNNTDTSLILPVVQVHLRLHMRVGSALPRHEVVKEAPYPVCVVALRSRGIVPRSDAQSELFQGRQRRRPAWLVHHRAGWPFTNNSPKCCSVASGSRFGHLRHLAQQLAPQIGAEPCTRARRVRCGSPLFQPSHALCQPEETGGNWCSRARRALALAIYPGNTGQLVPAAIPGKNRSESPEPLPREAVAAAIHHKHNSLDLEVPHEVDAFHAESLRGSRMTSVPPSSSWARVRFASSTRATAS